MAPVVLKMTPDQGKHKMLRDEAKAQEALPKHDNLVAGWGERTRGEGDDAIPVAVMEYAKHGDLKHTFKLLRLSTLGAHDKLCIIKHLLHGSISGLIKLHEAELVHADIKDENILLDKQFTPKLTDFGLTEHRSKKTRMVGTAAYMAPEVVERGVEQKSDVWSLGEMVLKGVTDKNSVNVHDPSTVKASSYRQEQRKKELAGDGWHKKLDTLPELKGMGDLVDLLKQSMTFETANRLSAKGMLKHKFFADLDAKKARRLLGELYTDAAKET